MGKSFSAGILVTTLILFIVLTPNLSLASAEPHMIRTDKATYMPNENIFLTISCRPKTFFTLEILNPNSIKIYEKSAITDSSGKYFLLLKGFSLEGVYKIKLESGDQQVISYFVVGKSSNLSKLPESVNQTTMKQNNTNVTSINHSNQSSNIYLNATTSTLKTDNILQEAVQSPSISNEQPRFFDKKAHWVKYVNISENWQTLTPQDAKNIKTKLTGFRSSQLRRIEYETPLPLRPKLTGKAGSKPIMETMKTDLFNLSSYGTEFELVDYHTSPVSQRITYKIFNSKPDNISYIAIAGNIQSFRAWHLINKTKQVYIENVTYYEGNVTDKYKDAPILEYIPLQLDIEANATYGNITRVGYPYYKNKTYTIKEYDEAELLFKTRGFMEKWYSDDPAIAEIKIIM